MRIFFALASVYLSDKAYRPSVQQMTASFRADATYLADAPAGASLSDWVVETLDGCDFAFFDVTGFDADVIYALGVASQGEVSPVCLIDRQKHKAAPGAAKLTAQSFRDFHDAGDFQRKVRLILEEKLGPDIVQNKVLEQRILQHIDKMTPKYMRQLASDVGREMEDVQPVVYSLVRQGVVKKLGDKRYAQYLRLT